MTTKTATRTLSEIYFYWNNWERVISMLRERPFRESLVVPKAGILHPSKSDGFYASSGHPVGQLRDFRKPLPDGAGLHVHEFADRFEAHLDEVDPSVDFVEHARRDAPQYYLLGAAAAFAVGARLAKAKPETILLMALAGVAIAALALPVSKALIAERDPGV